MTAEIAGHLTGAEASMSVSPRGRTPGTRPQRCDFILNGAPKRERSQKILGCALACYNAGWPFEDYARAILDPTNRGGEKLHRRRDARAYLERCWTKAQAFAVQSPAGPPAASEALARAHAARLRRRADTWPWPKRTGWTHRLVLEAIYFWLSAPARLLREPPRHFQAHRRRPQRRRPFPAVATTGRLASPSQGTAAAATRGRRLADNPPGTVRRRLHAPIHAGRFQGRPGASSLR
jgi:hypothetical protein